MHAGQVEVAPHDLTTALAAQFPEVAGLPVERVRSAGTVVAPFRVGPDLVARVPLVPVESPEVRDRLRREGEHAALLADRLAIDVPRQVGIGKPFPRYPGVWSLWTWLRGDSLDRLPVARDVNLAGELATVLLAIRSLPAEGGSWNGEGRGGQPLADTAWVRESIDRSSALVNRDRATAVWERALAVHPHDGAGTRIHGDPMPGNFLAVNGHLTGMVDITVPVLGDPAADLQPAWVLFDEPARNAFLAAMGLDDDARERGRGWAFEMAIGGLHYYEHSNRVFFRQAARTLERLIAE